MHGPTSPEPRGGGKPRAVSPCAGHGGRELKSQLAARWRAADRASSCGRGPPSPPRPRDAEDEEDATIAVHVAGAATDDGRRVGTLLYGAAGLVRRLAWSRRGWGAVPMSPRRCQGRGAGVAWRCADTFCLRRCNQITTPSLGGRGVFQRRPVHINAQMRGVAVLHEHREHAR